MEINLFSQNMTQLFFMSRRDPFGIVNPFPNKPWFLRVCSTSPSKTLWEKEKLLIKSNFSFSHSVFCRFQKLSAVFIKPEIVICKLFQFGRVQNLSFGKELTRQICNYKVLICSLSAVRIQRGVGKCMTEL